MPGNKKTTKKTKKPQGEPFIAKIGTVLYADGRCESMAIGDNRAVFMAMQGLVEAAGRDGKFNEMCSLFKQAQIIKRAMIRHRSWFYRNIIALFI